MSSSEQMPSGSKPRYRRASVIDPALASGVPNEYLSAPEWIWAVPLIVICDLVPDARTKRPSRAKIERHRRQNTLRTRTAVFFALSLCMTLAR